jgi:transcriptional regulator with XRE-family HTH domain
MELNTRATLGDEIRRVRMALGLSLRTLASRVAISPSLLTLVEHGNHVPPSDVIVDLAAELEVNADVLCGLAGKLTPRNERLLSSIAKSEPARLRSFLEAHSRNL